MTLNLDHLLRHAPRTPDPVHLAEVMARMRRAMEGAAATIDGNDPDGLTPAPHPAHQFLAFLGKDPSQTWCRTFYGKRSGNPPRPRKGRDLHGLDVARLQAENEQGLAVYAVVGHADQASGVSKATGKPTGAVTDDDITSCPAIFTEFDEKAKDWQRDAWREQGLPEPTLQLDSGGASIHSYWVFPEPVPPAKFRELQRRLIAHTGCDESIKNPSRVMRLPGFRHVNKETGELGEVAHLITVSTRRYSVAELETCLPMEQQETPLEQLQEPLRQPLEAAVPITLPSTGDLPPRRLEDVRAALQHIPPRVPGTGTYPWQREAALGYIHAVVEANPPGTVDQAVADLKARHPQWDDLDQVIGSSDLSAFTAGSFWHWVKANGGSDARPDLHGSAPIQLEPINSEQPGHASNGNGNGTAPAPAANKPKHRRLTAAQVLRRLPEALGGTPRLNSRTRFVELNGAVLTGDEIDRIYLDISTDQESWPKQTTTDAALGLAHRHTFDPVADYLERTAANVAPLPLDQWQRLDRLLLGIDDPIAAAFLPQYLIGAVARTYRPGCSVRRSPVLIGKQWRGKTALGEILFGADHWAEGLQGTSDRDIRARCHTVWGVELSELNGITRRSDQEHLKAFLTERVDILRRAYGKGEERNPRRFVFWGTSNGPPLRDLSGSTRFVCIPLPDRMLPLEWAEEHRDALWSRAVEQYRQIPAGEEPWDRVTEEERALIEERNANHQEIDPWAEEVERILAEEKAALQLPVSIPMLLDRLDIPRSQQTNATAARVRQLAERIGWTWARRRPDPKEEKRRGLWPPDPAGPAAGPPGPAVGRPGEAQPNASGGAACEQVGPPGPTDSLKVENREEEQGQQQGAAAQSQGLGAIGRPGRPTPPNASGGVGSAGPGRGAQRAAQTPPPWFEQLVALRRTRPTDHAHTLAITLDPLGQWGINGAKVAAWLPLADQQIRREAEQ